MKDFFTEKLAKLPSNSGVYLMKDNLGKIIYIGKAKVLRSRVASYFNAEVKDFKTQTLVSHIADFDYVVTSSELDALILENNLIKKHQPHYNLLLKDGKSYPYIRITMGDDFPKIDIVRKIKKDKSKYFGPYFSGIKASEVIETLNYAYPIRTCNLNLNNGRKTKRACLNYSLGLCSAPCIGKIKKEDYAEYIKFAIEFLNGKTQEVEKILQIKMEQAAKMQKFEMAISLREKIKILERLKQKFTTQFTTFVDIDVIGYYDNGINDAIAILIIRGGKMLGCDNILLGRSREETSKTIESFIMQYYAKDKIIPEQILVGHPLEDKEIISSWLSSLKGKKVEISLPQKGVKNKLLQTATKNAKEHLNFNTQALQLKEDRTIGALKVLKEKLNLPIIPTRIECYDISNISGSDKVASMVVFLNGEKASGHYRKFKIKTVEGIDDFASMEEVIYRRFLKLKEEDYSFSSLPDLVVIDGGRGQLSAAVKGAKKAGDFNTTFIALAKREEEIFKTEEKLPYLLPKSSYGLALLQRIRDEAHRFALTYHRNLRQKRIKSVLEDIPGVGPVKRNLLLKTFKSVKNIKQASIDEISKLKGFNQTLANDIKEFLKDK